MEPLKAAYAITTLDGRELFSAGDMITKERIDALNAQSAQSSHKAWPILDYGSIKRDLLFFISSPPYNLIFQDSDGVAEILDIMQNTKLVEPVLEMLDYFEQYDHFTYRHMLTVFALTILISRELIPDYRLRVSEAAYGPTHDFGKICVPLEILKKEKPLTRDELQQLRHHSQAGYVLLSYYLNDTESIAARVARDHHERRDYSGYPRGISLNDRVVEIVAVCDIYDALISKRPYRKESYDNRTALEILTEMAGNGQIGWDTVKALIASNRRT
jgi:HD-GYP domain-containing protein (c-di-GMP phosphodiesterase class II)